MPYRTRTKRLTDSVESICWNKEYQYDYTEEEGETLRAVVDTKVRTLKWTNEHSYERMFDWFDSPFDKRVLSDNPCEHVRCTASGNLSMPTWTYYVGGVCHNGVVVGGRGQSRIVQSWSGPYRISASALESRLPSPPGTVLAELAYQSVKSITDDIRQQGSLLNFLYELRDFRKLIGPLRSTLGRLREFFSKPGLVWEFAVKPFIDDLKKLLGSIKYVNDRIKWLASHNGQETIANFTVDDVGWEWLPDIGVPNPGLYPDTVAWITSKSVTFRAHARIRISCKYLESLSRRIDAYMHALGVGGIFQWIEAGYHAIPFSWLVDFFFKTSRLFDKLDSPLFSEYGIPPIEIVSLSHSFKSKATFEFWGRIHTDSDACDRSGSTRLVKVGAGQVKKYVRRAGLPDGGHTILSHHSTEQDLGMLSILTQILLPGIPWGRKGRRTKLPRR